MFTNATKPEQIGYDVLHKIAVTSVQSMKSCLEDYGVNDCVISPERNKMHEDSFMSTILKHSCYSVFIREALKFVPRVSRKKQDVFGHPFFCGKTIRCVFRGYPDCVIKEVLKTYLLPYPNLPCT